MSSPPPLIRPFRPTDTDPVVDLWHLCGLTRPWNDPRADISRKMALADGLFSVAESAGVIVGTVMAGYDGHRGWINYLAVAPDRRAAGIGRLLVEFAERSLVERGCPKVNLQIRSGNRDAAEFYSRLGYSVDDVVSMGRRLVDDI